MEVTWTSHKEDSTNSCSIVFSRLRLSRCHNADIQRVCNLFEVVTGCHKVDTTLFVVLRQPLAVVESL